MSASISLNVTVYGMLGVALGTAYFAALRLNVRLYCYDAAVWKTVFVHLLRIVGVGAVFTVCARHGAVPLLSNFGGFTVMRAASLWPRDFCFKSNTRPEVDRAISSDRQGHI